MTLEEFCKELENCKGKFDIVSNYLQIRFYKEGELYCPITAVCYVKYNKFHNIVNYQMAANLLGLTREQCEIIANSADNRVYSGYYKEGVRDYLLRAL